jgi:hypothetical protein
MGADCLLAFSLITRVGTVGNDQNMIIKLSDHFIERELNRTVDVVTTCSFTPIESTDYKSNDFDVACCQSFNYCIHECILVFAFRPKRVNLYNY